MISEASGYDRWAKRTISAASEAEAGAGAATRAETGLEKQGAIKQVSKLGEGIMSGCQGLVAGVFGGLRRKGASAELSGSRGSKGVWRTGVLSSKPASDEGKMQSVKSVWKRVKSRVDASISAGGSARSAPGGQHSETRGASLPKRLARSRVVEKVAKIRSRVVEKVARIRQAA